MYSYGPPHMAELKQDDQLEHTYSSYVRIQDVAQKICSSRWTIGKSGERGSGISVLPARHDDDDDDDDIDIYVYKKNVLWIIYNGWYVIKTNQSCCISGFSVLKFLVLFFMCFCCTFCRELFVANFLLRTFCCAINKYLFFLYIVVILMKQDRFNFSILIFRTTHEWLF